jgi:hypothetical protein
MTMAHGGGTPYRLNMQALQSHGATVALLVAALSVACGSGGGGGEVGGGGEYVPAVPGTWLKAAGPSGSVIINPVEFDDNFFNAGPVEVFIPGEVAQASAELVDGKIDVPLDGGGVTTLQFVGNVLLRRDGSVDYWKSFTPAIAGGWRAVGDSEHLLCVEALVVDATKAYNFAGAELHGNAESSLSGRVELESHGVDYDGNEVLEADVSELVLEEAGVERVWSGTFDGLSTLRLVSESSRLTFQRERSLAECD